MAIARTRVRNKAKTKHTYNKTVLWVTDPKRTKSYMSYCTNFHNSDGRRGVWYSFAPSSIFSLVIMSATLLFIFMHLIIYLRRGRRRPLFLQENNRISEVITQASDEVDKPPLNPIIATRDSRLYEDIQSHLFPVKNDGPLVKKETLDERFP